MYTARFFDDAARELSGVAVHWTSSDTVVAVVDGAGAVHTRAPGVTTIAASSGSARAAASLWVVAHVRPAIAGIGPPMIVGDTAHLTIYVPGPAPAAGSRQAIWSSSDPSVATIDSAGVVRALRSGATAIVAAAYGLADTATLQVSTLASIMFSPPLTGSLFPGDSVRAYAHGLDPSGLALRIPSFTWRSEDTTIATVDTTGMVHAVASGTTRIAAASHGITGYQAVTVAGVASACLAAGTTHSGVIATPETWTRAGSPHHIGAGELIVENAVTIDAGAVVCGAPGASIKVYPGAVGVPALLDVQGTAAAPVLFTAKDPAQPWRGLVADSSQGHPTIRLAHATIEYATDGIFANGADVTVDSSVFRQVPDTAVYAQFGTAHLRGTRIDTVGTGIAIAFMPLVVEQTTILHAGSSGISCNGGSVTLNGVRIEGSAKGALNLGWPFWDCALPSASAVRLVGNGGIGDMTVEDVGVLVAGSAHGDSLRGNVADSVLLHYRGHLSGDVVFPGGIRFYAINDSITGHGTLRLEPGADLEFPNPGFGLALGDSVRLMARGTAALPVTIASAPYYTGRITLGGVAAAADTIAHARILHLGIVAAGAPGALLDSTLVDGAPVVLRSAGGAIVGSIVRSVHNGPAVTLAAAGTTLTGTVIQGTTVDNGYVPAGDGVLVDAPGAVISGCELSGNAGSGVSITGAGGATIHQCNLHDNGAYGVNSAVPNTDARSNWWGDPAGPAGPAGDGISAGVDASDPLPAPVPVPAGAPGG